MTLVTIICFFLLFILLLPYLISTLLKLLLKKLSFKIEMNNIMEYKNLYFSLDLKSKLSIFAPLKLMIPSIRIKKTPKKFHFQIIIEKIYIKAHISGLDLKSTHKNKMDDIFTMNLLKILDFTQNYFYSNSSSLNLPQKNSTENKNLSMFAIFMKLFGFLVLPKFSLNIHKIRFDIIQTTSEIPKETFENPYENLVHRIKIYKSHFYCISDLKVSNLDNF